MLRKGRPTYHISEPYLRFHHAVMRPRWSTLERSGAAAEVWADAEPTFRSAILGPAFDDITRAWLARYAAPAHVGGTLSEVGRTVFTDRAGRSRYEVDIVGLGQRDDGAIAVRVLGECKYGRILGMQDLRRLQRVRDLLAQRVDVTDARLLLASGAGFSSELRDAAVDPEILLVDPERLYGGD
ncbi:hypothetical protein BH23ACT10_BH23ACT10_39350 [soil metagenome]